MGFLNPSAINLDDRVADCPKRKNGIMSSIIFFIVEVNKRLSKSFSFDWG
jgi:hypothetical protein